jgi:thioredoxin reductase
MWESYLRQWKIMQSDKVVIIGAGPAGMTAAIQLKRYASPFVLLEKERVGGLLWNANLVENYPGFPGGVSGPKLIGLMEKQMERIGVEVTFDSVSSLSYEDDRFLVETSHASYCPRYVVVASGTQPKPFPISIPKDAQSKVFSDVFHLLDTREKHVAIVGAGDAAFDYALNLVKRGNFVTILNRGAEVKCLGLLWDRVMAEPAIEYRAETPVRKVELDEKASRLEVGLDADESLEADYLLFAIGRIPQMDFISASVREQESVLKAEGRLYFAGDVQNGLLRQTAISAGDGLRAAMQIYHSLEEGFI